MSPLLRRLAMAVEIGGVVWVLPMVESGRRRLGPKPLIGRLRGLGRRRRERGPVARARLQHAIRWVDRRFPDRGNCYRRALLEIALDRGAAAEPFRMGLQLHGETEPGHAWLGDRDGRSEDYDAVIVL
jgi:hypothetical protein